MRGLSLVAVSWGHSSSRCVGLSLSRPLLLPSTGSRRTDSVVVAHGPSSPRHVGSSQTRARTHVPCTGRQILNHCATREAWAWSDFYLTQVENGSVGFWLAISFDKWLFNYLACLYWLVNILLMICRNYLCILDGNPLSDICIMNIFSSLWLAFLFL